MTPTFDMELQLIAARTRLKHMDAIDGGPGTGEMALRTVLMAFASGLCTSQCTDHALWEAYAMLEHEVELACGHSFGTCGMQRHVT